MVRTLRHAGGRKVVNSPAGSRRVWDQSPTPSRDPLTLLSPFSFLSAIRQNFFGNHELHQSHESGKDLPGSHSCHSCHSWFKNLLVATGRPDNSQRTGNREIREPREQEGRWRGNAFRVFSVFRGSISWLRPEVSMADRTGTGGQVRGPAPTRTVTHRAGRTPFVRPATDENG